MFCFLLVLDFPSMPTRPASNLLAYNDAVLNDDTVTTGKKLAPATHLTQNTIQCRARKGSALQKLS